MILLTSDQKQYVQGQIDELRATLAGDGTESNPATELPAAELPAAELADQPSESPPTNVGEMLKILSAASRAYEASQRSKPSRSYDDG